MRQSWRLCAICGFGGRAGVVGCVDGGLLSHFIEISNCYERFVVRKKLWE